jgi:hypothetical protein
MFAIARKTMKKEEARRKHKHCSKQMSCERTKILIWARAGKGKTDKDSRDMVRQIPLVDKERSERYENLIIFLSRKKL